jgi:hypothetical protein
LYQLNSNSVLQSIRGPIRRVVLGQEEITVKAFFAAVAAAVGETVAMAVEKATPLSAVEVGIEAEVTGTTVERGRDGTDADADAIVAVVLVLVLVLVLVPLVLLLMCLCLGKEKAKA